VESWFGILVLLGVSVLAGVCLGGNLIQVHFPVSVSVPVPAPIAPTAVPEPITGSALLDSDGVTIRYLDPSPVCRYPRLAAGETSTQVYLSLIENNGGYMPCPPPGRDQRTATVTLTSPLGTRALLDALTGKAVPYFDLRRALSLRAPPPSSIRWRADSTEPLTSSATAAPFFGGPGAAVLVRGYLGEDPNPPPGSPATWQLQVVEVIGGTWHPPAGTVTARVTVRGLPGLAAPGIVVWTEAGMTVGVVGYAPPGPMGTSMSGDTHPLATAQLIDIANHLTGGAS
jgi:hypothetical protein